MSDWDRILDRHGLMVWRMAYRMLGSAHEAQDCMQEVFLSAVALSRREHIRNWKAVLRHLTRMRALDELRSRTLRKKREENMADFDTHANRSTDPVQVVEAAELASRLRDALSQLPPRQAEVFAMRFIEQMTYQEIADALDLKRNAVGVLLHEARNRLRVLLAAPKEQGAR